MARQIDYRSTSKYPADEVYATMVDADYLRARLEQLGGPNAALLEHAVDDAGAHYRIRHGLDGSALPPVVRTLMPGNVMIERAERWTREDVGRFAGEVRVTIHGTPASAAGGMRLRDTDSDTDSDTDRGASELLVRADVTVNVPLFGGRIEAVVAEQVQNLLAAEFAFTQQWLAKAH